MVTSGGWTWGSINGTGTNLFATTTGTGGFSGNGGTSFLLAGSSGGASYQMIAIGWNASAGANPFSGYTSLDLGWSCPFTYLTGATITDPNGGTPFSGTGMNQFGVAPIPEPSTIALAGLGGLSLLLFRRRK